MSTWEVYDRLFDIALGSYDSEQEAWEVADEHKIGGGKGALIEHRSDEDGQPVDAKLLSIW